jgi:hypothetical protein
MHYQRAGDVFVAIIAIYIAMELLLLFRSKRKTEKT